MAKGRVHFARAANWEFTLNNRFDLGTREMLADLAADHNASHGNSEKVSLAVNWIYEPTANYYRLARGLTWLEPVSRRGRANRAPGSLAGPHHPRLGVGRSDRRRRACLCPGQRGRDEPP